LFIHELGADTEKTEDRQTDEGEQSLISPPNGLGWHNVVYVIITAEITATTTQQQQHCVSNIPAQQHVILTTSITNYLQLLVVSINIATLTRHAHVIMLSDAQNDQQAVLFS